MELGALAWTEIDAPVVVVPVGSCEQHGGHLPVRTDSIVAEALAHELASIRADAVIAPTLGITASGEHQGFPGTLSIGTDVMAQVVVELVRSADWASGVVFVNGHGGNAAAMQRAHRVADAEGRRVLVWWPRIADGDLHAGATETSLLLHLEPEAVRTDRMAPGPTPPLDQLVEHGVLASSPSGVLGDPTRASAEHGARLFAELVDQLVDAVASWAARAT